MSADNVSICPACAAHELREWWEFLTDAYVRKEYKAKPVSVTADYYCECRSCGYIDEFQFTHTYKVTS